MFSSNNRSEYGVKRIHSRAECICIDAYCLEEENLCFATLPLIFDTLHRKATKSRPMCSEESCHSVTQSVVFVETLKSTILLLNEESDKSFVHNVHFSTGIVSSETNQFI